MNKKIFLLILFVIMLLAIGVGAILKITHSPHAGQLLTTGIVAQALFIMVAGVELFKAAIPFWQKPVWLALLVFGSVFGAAGYIFFREKMVINPT